MTTVDAPQEQVVPNTAEEILAAVQELIPELRARSAEIEQNRQIPGDVVALIRNAGVFRMGFAKEFGGPDLTSMEQTRVLEALAYADTAVGWCGMVGIDSGLYSAYLSESTVREMFPSPDMVISGLISPAGRAERVPGGYRLSGRWNLGSGITHADWISAGALTYTDGVQDVSAAGKANWRVMLVRPSEVELIDTWHTTGLAGTGSMDYRIDDVFVPEDHTFSFGTARSRSGPMAGPDTLMRKMPGVPLGAARAALDYVRDMARTRVNRMSGEPWSEDYRVQFTLGECEMDYIAVRHAVYGTVEHRWNRMAAGATFEDFTTDERVSTTLVALKAFRTALSIVRRLYDLLQTTSIYRTSPMDRWLRDLNTMCQHVMAQDVIVQTAGAHLIGGQPRFPFALGIAEH
ncbi:alkylation response protein AidB-like acyl-CoA dehydrogenase [Halopolyspora algeriensis]|uniref:Alkylation response protein AidB-like acyl-CoA dehydrogenase n=1 Tax=Halopolyspora algeriensis TaxID=1500506 RepID=A0A368VBP3_9ACTN|nr:acyl-CoA dehydrogenase family protein [Halopolyspora algeriensis]RCW37655.1 alkylation response protein AidB-like acyl-CoA dehydrogenase [Halopolyspora algeriensis]TQM53811.1 alkylation response protein AidB-like acyl-CoA dehydrogenase [Halopolyspora algeriensis]